MALLELIKGFFGVAFGATFGYIAAFAVIAIFTCLFVGSGSYILKKYNKKNTALLQNIESMQYVGIVLIIIGLLPFLQYFMISFMGTLGSNAAEYAGNELFGESD